MPDLPVAQQSAMLAQAFTPGTTYYLSLHTADPVLTGASEVSSGGYARQAVVFGTSGATLVSTDAQTFTVPALPSGVRNFGIWSAATGGTYLGGGTTTGLAVSIPAGTTLTFAIGALVLSVT
jgi:hypothetical protein